MTLQGFAGPDFEDLGCLGFSLSAMYPKPSTLNPDLAFVLAGT